MPVFSRKMRRWLIALTLLSAILLLVIGQTFLKSSLAGKMYIIYWSVCMFFTVLAMYLALLEVKYINTESRKEFRDLLENTLDEIRKNYDEKIKEEIRPDKQKTEKP
jgi:membrane-anchored protein YejM (alkaline phosphatase superfamily)